MEHAAVIARLAGEHRERLYALDSLASPTFTELGESDTVLLPPAGEQALAAGVVRTSSVGPDEPTAPWRTLTQHELMLLAGDGPRSEVQGHLDAVLDEVDVRVRRGDVLADPETSLVTVTAAKDDVSLEPLRHHNFAPLLVTSLRRISASEALNASYPISLPAGVRIVSMDELDPEVALQACLRAWGEDSEHRRVVERPSNQDVIERVMRFLVGQGAHLSAVAMREDRIVGLSLVAELDERHTEAPTPVRPIASGLLLWTEKSERNRGLATRMLQDAHGRIARAAIPWCMTQYPAAHPINGYFWARAGYRPLLLRWWKFSPKAHA